MQAGFYCDALLSPGGAQHTARGGPFKSVGIIGCSCFLSDECLHPSLMDSVVEARDAFAQTVPHDC